MSDTVIVALIGAIALVFAAAIGLTGRVVIERLDRAARAAETARLAAVAAKVAAEASAREIVATKDGIFEIGRRIDGRLSQLLKSETALARAQGKLEEAQAQRDRASDPSAPAV